MRCIFFLFLLFSNILTCLAQEKYSMKIEKTDGSEIVIPTSQLNSWSFVLENNGSGDQSQEKEGMSPLSGKSIIFIGDSYVANNGQPVEQTWQYLMAKNNAMTYYNRGVNGTCIVGDQGLGTNFIERLDTIDTIADYVITIGGRNDYNRQVPIDEFKEGLRSYCEKLYDKYLGKKLAFFTPWRISNTKNIKDDKAIKLQDYIDAIIEVVGEYSIPVFDASRNSGLPFWKQEFRKRYTQAAYSWGDYWDYSHLNAEGHLLFLNKAESFIKSL